MKILYIANIRLPTEKAHGLAVMKMCEAFVKGGEDVELVIPRRINKIKEDAFAYYELEKNFKIRWIPVIDLIPWFDKVGFFLETFTFSISTFIYCLFSQTDIFYGRDEVSLGLISLFKKNVVWEAHTAKKKWLVVWLLKRAKKIVAISNGLKEYYISLGVPNEKILVAPSGVDIESFEKIRESKEKLRKKLNLPLDKKLIAYIGKLHTMGKEKGVKELDSVMNEVRRIHSEAELLIVSEAKPNEVPAYMKAADILIMNYPNSEHYAKYMSPLKLFEYMASGTPIITSDLPSIREILDESTAILVKPGDRHMLTEGIKKTLDNPVLARRIAQAARLKVKQYTWENRAHVILASLCNLRYQSIVKNARRLLSSFESAVVDVPYEIKGILNSEMLFLHASLPEDFCGRILESGRARGQSTLMLSLMFPNTSIMSMEFNKDSPDVLVAAERLRGRENVTLLYGDATKILPKMVQAGDAVLIDGPKRFLAVRLALRILATGKPIAVFIHDMRVGTPYRSFLERFLPETLFSDARAFAEFASPLDANAVAQNSTHIRLDEVVGDFGYGFSLAHIPVVTGRRYQVLLAVSYPYVIVSRVWRRLLRLMKDTGW